MDATNTKNHSFDSSMLLQQLYEWRWILISTVVISALAGAIFSSSYFITPLYKSTVIMYPTGSSSISRTLISDNSSNNDLLKIGDEEQTEQMLQLLNSNQIRNRIIEKFDLLKHYGIRPESKFVKTKLYKEYQGNFKFSRTEYMAIEVIVWDKNPDMAANMANEICGLIDSIKNTIQKKRAVKGFQIVEQEYFQLQKEIAIKEDSLTKLRVLGIHDYETQAEMINQQLAIEIAEGNQAAIKRLEKRLSLLAKYGSSYVSLRETISNDLKRLSFLKSKYNEAKVDAEELIPQKFVVNKAYSAEKKSYPIRWLIVLLSCFSTTLFAFVILLFIEKLKTISLKDQ